MKSHEIPDRPWERVGIDLFELDGENFMVISDYYSKFFEITKLPNTKSSTVISHLGPHFGRYGNPEKLLATTVPNLQVQSSRSTQHAATSATLHHLQDIHSQMAWLNEQFKLLRKF